MKQTTKITFERQVTVLLKESSALTDGFCSTCQEVVVLATPESVSIACQISEREIFRRIETGEVHFVEGPKVYVCLNSMKMLDRTRLPQIYPSSD